jgi:hypothetical protein
MMVVVTVDIGGAVGGVRSLELKKVNNTITEVSLTFMCINVLLTFVL